MSTRRSFWTILGACVLAVIVACGGSSDTPASQTPTASPALTRAEAEQQAGFTFLLPSNLPAKVDPEPQYTVLARNRGVNIRYSPAGDGKEAESPTILLHEQNGGGLEPNAAYVTETIGGISVKISDVTIGDVPAATADVTGVWSQGTLQLSAEIIWGLDSTPVELTDEMKAVARRTIESIISPQSSP
jgi:hypothetical protein